MRFCANVSILFKEAPFLERFGRARRAGFWWPDGEDLGEVEKAVEEAGLSVALDLARENVAWAADRAAQHGVEVLIEAVNTFENGPYLLHTTKDAAEFVAGVGKENVRLQYDVYHMQRMEGNLVATLREHIGEIAHVQVADSPGRGEPGTGEIHYPYVFAALEELGYDGYVGLEYGPTTEKTEDSFTWIPESLRGGEVRVEDLNL